MACLSASSCVDMSWLLKRGIDCGTVVVDASALIGFRDAY